MSRKDITSLFQWLDAFEERVGVRIEAVSAFESIDEDGYDVDIKVFGELHSTSGTKLDQDISLELAVYDAEGRVIQTKSEWVDAESFFGFHTFQIRCFVEPGVAKKLRLVPKPT